MVKKTKSVVFEHSKLSGGSAKSKSQGHLTEIDEQQYTNLTKVKYIDEQSLGKQQDRSRRSLKSRIANWFSSGKLLGKGHEQWHSESGIQSSDAVDTSETKQKTTSNVLTGPYRNIADDDEQLKSGLSSFDMVFYVPLRHAKQGISTVVDLVCCSVSGCDLRTRQKMKQILHDASISCLVILDGLDEWRAPDACRVMGFPDSDGLVNCTLLCTMRPWRMVNLRLGLDSTCDKVVQILGLQQRSVKTIIKNVLVNFYGFDISSALYKQKFKHFCANAKLPGMKSLLKVPLMLTSSCVVWNEEVERDRDQGDLDSYESSCIESDDYYSDSDDSSCSGSDENTVSYFMTFFYLKMIEITIARAKLKHEMVRYFLLEKQKNGNTSQDIPHILSVFCHITDFFDVVKSIGRLALYDLVSDQTYLVFPIDKLERDIGHSKVELALKAGILSQTKAPGLSFQQRVSVSFYHKSIQEFIAALYMASEDTETLTSFCTHCTSVDKVIELSNMIRFVFGLDPVVGCRLSDHVREVVNCDTDIIQYRESTHNSDKVKEMYKIQCKWHSEMKQNLSHPHNTDHTPTLRVTDIYLSRSWPDSVNVEDVSVASELVVMEDNSIVSVYLNEVRHPVHSILQHLPGCKHLTTLYITNITDTQGRELLPEVLPQLVQLQCVVYGNEKLCPGKHCPPGDTAVVRAVQQLPALIYIELRYITLTNVVTLPLQLETVKLYVVHPAHLILPSVCQCIQLNCIELERINLTDTVTLPPQLQMIKLMYVYESHFILQSLCQCSQLTSIELVLIDLTDTVTLPSQLQKVKLDYVQPAHFILPSVPGCNNITSLHILQCLNTMEDCKMLVSVLPQLQCLQYIHYDGRWSSCGSAGHAAVVSALQHLTQLTHIELGWIELGDDATLLVTPHMTQLQEVKLTHVDMSARRWTEFVSSLLRVQHKVTVSLIWTNIDGDTVKTIHSSPHFTVTEESRTNIEFHTVQ